MTTGQFNLSLDSSTHGCNHERSDHLGKTVSFFSKAYNRLVDAWQFRQQQRINRDAFKNMLTLDERALKDIGVTRADVLWASNLPLSRDAAVELQNLKIR